MTTTPYTGLSASYPVRLRVYWFITWPFTMSSSHPPPYPPSRGSKDYKGLVNNVEGRMVLCCLLAVLQNLYMVTPFRRFMYSLSPSDYGFGAFKTRWQERDRAFTEVLQRLSTTYGVDGSGLRQLYYLRSSTNPGFSFWAIARSILAKGVEGWDACMEWLEAHANDSGIDQALPLSETELATIDSMQQSLFSTSAAPSDNYSFDDDLILALQQFFHKMDGSGGTFSLR